MGFVMSSCHENSVPAIGFIDDKFDVAGTQQSGGHLAAAVGVTEVSDAAMATGLADRPISAPGFRR